MKEGSRERQKKTVKGSNLHKKTRNVHRLGLFCLFIENALDLQFNCSRFLFIQSILCGFITMQNEKENHSPIISNIVSLII